MEMVSRTRFTVETDTLHFSATEETGAVSCSEPAIKAVRRDDLWKYLGRKS